MGSMSFTSPCLQRFLFLRSDLPKIYVVTTLRDSMLLGLKSFSNDRDYGGHTYGYRKKKKDQTAKITGYTHHKIQFAVHKLRIITQEGSCGCRSPYLNLGHFFAFMSKVKVLRMAKTAVIKR